jgi:hypothetical protein
MMEWPQKEPAESGATIVTTQESNVKHTAEGMANHGRLPLELADGVVPRRKVSRWSPYSTSGGPSNAIFRTLIQTPPYQDSSTLRSVPVHLADILYFLLAV